MLLQSIERSPLKINVRENRRDNQEWKIQDEDKQQREKCINSKIGKKNNPQHLSSRINIMVVD
jgi:hypothetical protein